jgi:hypothetical protein
MELGPVRVVFKLQPQEVFVVVKLFDPIHDENFASIKIFLKEKYYNAVKSEWTTKISANNKEQAKGFCITEYSYTSFLHETAYIAHNKMMEVFRNLWGHVSGH